MDKSKLAKFENNKSIVVGEKSISFPYVYEDFVYKPMTNAYFYLPLSCERSEKIGAFVNSSKALIDTGADCCAISLSDLESLVGEKSVDPLIIDEPKYLLKDYDINFPLCTGKILQNGILVVIGELPKKTKEESEKTCLNRMYMQIRNKKQCTSTISQVSSSTETAPIKPHSNSTNSSSSENALNEDENEDEVIIHTSDVSSELCETSFIPQYVKASHLQYPYFFLNEHGTPSCVAFLCPVVGIPNLPHPLIGRKCCIDRLAAKFEEMSDEKERHDIEDECKFSLTNHQIATLEGKGIVISFEDED
ncbi:uncharacterized protein MONOS_1057 [Monocercomonoides exilis]|uniref:uncharacterized protein n=1 Tax=Monocercomonoides exilis TaxID=2049356 RepID=UPI00355A2CF7|nr:hypothetical protein MONOS_1057 [Monocercomonoides exilis]|eukprot:MONOS_1057.1-p1 / transcript=MONOS_1057.1 / gene=MONOS_1057 / organism=Monocercomonoides_exilis_PA203 / gene_product=unspecified product / transcript_product=unspecified product / location=Mono_scaffold00018:22610-23732(+) / protein_length=306 / sequence_SO=supercontig / SO=protein_coding / is_pseudo=false